VSYDLDLFRGDVEAGEEEWDALDLAVARASLRSLTGEDVVDEELVWELDAAAATFFLSIDEQGVLRSVGVMVNVLSGAVEQARDDYRRVLEVMLELGRRLDGKVYDPQLGAHVDRASAPESIDSFG
jgi:hypothetical protein